MIMAPGGYRFGDYWKLGLPILLLWFAVALIVIPIVWPTSAKMAADDRRGNRGRVVNDLSMGHTHAGAYSKL